MLKRYLAKRLLIAIPSLLIASLIVFTLPRLLPGDAVQLMLAEKAYAKDVEELRTKLGLDRPLFVQYFEWLGRVSRGDFGESLWTRRPVLREIGQRLPVTMELAVFALAFALLIALPVGVLSAARQDTIQDYVRTAWAKALGERVIVMKHGLRNAIIPVVTLLGTQLPQIIGGTVIIETVFGLPGMSRFLFDAINQRDYPVIQGVNLVVVSTIVMINLAVDALYAVLDPRIRY